MDKGKVFERLMLLARKTVYRSSSCRFKRVVAAYITTESVLRII